MEKHHFIDIHDYKETCDNFKLSVHLDPVRNYVQNHSVQFPWIYRAQSSILYLEELDPERRIRDAYLKGERVAKETVLFHPYKKPYTSRVLRKFILEDPYNPTRAMIKYCNEKPISFVLFSKPGLNSDSLAIELSKYSNNLLINPTNVANELAESNNDVRSVLQNGCTIDINNILPAIKDKLLSAESKRQGYILTGLPVRQHFNSEFHVLEQMEMIFDSEARPDIIIYIVAPSNDISNLNEESFIQDINSGSYYLNKSHVEDGEKLARNTDLHKLEKLPEKDYNYYLMKEYENYHNIEKHGFPINIGRLPTYSKTLVEDYVHKILPIIDSYILEYDTQCVIKIDGRVPVTKMLELVKAKLSQLPFLPKCEARPMFKEVIKTEVKVELADDRSVDSLEEDKPEINLEEDDEEEIVKDEEGQEEEEEEEKPGDKEEGGEEETEEKGEEKQLHHFDNMAPKEALRRLKEFNKIEENFKWNESDFGVYCPVEYERGHISLGLPKYTCLYMGKLYMMSSYTAMGEFLFNPSRFVIPPKPFPTCKIFVVGPPCSGKTSVVKILSEFFNLEVVSIKQLMEEMSNRKFYELELHELVRKNKQISKVQNFENEIFQSYERKRGSDIIDWIKSQLPYIHQRIKFTSLIEIPQSDDEIAEHEMEPEENEDEEDSYFKEKLILPAYEEFLESVKNLSKTDIKSVIGEKKYAIDFPNKSGYEKIYENPNVDRDAMLVKKVPFQVADIDLKTLKEEFKKIGLDFNLDTEEYINIYTDPIGLLEYLPYQFRQPYYPNPSIGFDDPRVRMHVGEVGLRTAFGYVSGFVEELADLFEKKILEIEAEINLRKTGGDLQIGGWIVDDIPLTKPFWDILIERYLLPDDIVIRTVNSDSYKTVIQSFCDITGWNTLNFDNGKSIAEPHLSQEDSTDSIKDTEVNRFLEVKNSFLQLNTHYKNELETLENEEMGAKKTCSVREETIIKEDIFPKQQSPKQKHKVQYLLSTEATTCDSTFQLYNRCSIQNPFDIRILPIKPFHVNFWDDVEFLAEYYREITSTRQTKEVQSVEVQTLFTAPHPQTQSTEFKRLMSDCPSKFSTSNHHTISQESISSSSSSSTESSKRGMLYKRERCTDTTVKEYLSGKTRLSLMKKIKINRSPRSLYEAKRASHIDDTEPEPLFELHNKVILDVSKSKSRVYKLLEAFYQEINSHISVHPKTFEFKYLTEIRRLLEDNDLVQVANIMAKYIRRIAKESDGSKDNIIVIKPFADISVRSENKLKANSEIRLITSDLNPRGSVRRIGSNLDFEQLKSTSSSMVKLRTEPSESDLSKVSLPLIRPRSGEGPEKDTESGDIICYKEPLQDMYKSSSCLLNMDSLPMIHSNVSIPPKKSGKLLHLPKIDGGKEPSQDRSCHCLKLCKDEFCTCTSDSRITERNKKRICILDESETILPWIPQAGREKKSQLFEKTLQRPRGQLGLSMTESELEANESINEHLNNETVLPEQHKSINLEPMYDLMEKFSDFSEGISNEFEMMEEFSYCSDETTEDHEESQKHRRSKRRSTKDILKYSQADSTLSVLFDPSGDFIRYRPTTFDGSLDEGDEDTEQYLFNETASTKFDSREIVPLLPKNLGSDFKTADLLPGVTGVEWEKFITFVNSLYLSVSTFRDMGYKQDSMSFYLECCPSGSDSSISEYQKQASTKIRKSNRRVNTVKIQAKGFVAHLRSEDDDETGRSEGGQNQEEEDVCVLEVALPMTEEHFNTALNTALRCLTTGKTISELFSVSKHGPADKKRLSSSTLDAMYEDKEIRVIKRESETSSFDQASVQMPIDDVSSRDAVFDEKGKLIETNTEFIELYEGNLMRYKSLDERFRVSLEALLDEAPESDHESETGKDICPEIFLDTVPRAILYIPYVIPRFRPVTAGMRIQTKHLQRYYSLQSMCKLVIVERDVDTEEEIEAEEEQSLTFRYILKTPSDKKTESIYIHRRKKSLVELPDPQEEEDEGFTEKELQMIQEIIEPLIDVYQEELINAELNEYNELQWHETEEEQLEEEQLEESDTDTKLINKMREKLELTFADEPEVFEETIDRKLQFAIPNDITKLMFQKYDFIPMQFPENDIDETLQKELDDIKLPNTFENFLMSMDYNMKKWMSEWEILYNDVLSNITCNMINIEFLPFYHDLKKHLSDGVSQLLHGYEPLAECIDDDKEKLIKTIDLETTQINEDEIENAAEIESAKAEIKERDLGETEALEFLPNEYSDFYPYCPVLYNKTDELIPANDIYRAEHKDRTYNFSSEDAMNEFIMRPERFAVIKDSNYNRPPIRICVVAPQDFDGIHIARNTADCLGLTLKTLSSEIKRIYGTTLNLPVGVFDEDPTNIKLFSLDETKEEPTEDALENIEWEHLRNYFDLKSPLLSGELDALIDPLWKTEYGFILYSFPHSFHDFDYMVQTKKIPDAVVFIDGEQHRALKRQEIEERIRVRQALNFGARLKRLLAADHVRYCVWTEAYPRLFNTVLRTFLQKRRRDRIYRDRLNLVLPTIMQQGADPEYEEVEEEEGDQREWGIQWLLSQVRPDENPDEIPDTEIKLKMAKKQTDVLDSPNIDPTEKQAFLARLQEKETTIELVKPVEIAKLSTEEDDCRSVMLHYLSLSEIDFPDLQKIFAETPLEASEEASIIEECEAEYPSTNMSESSLKMTSDEILNRGIKLVDRRITAQLDMFNPTFPKKYIPQFTPVIYKSQRPFNVEDLRANVTDASSTSLLGHEKTDSIESRELTSSLSLLDIESRNKQIRLLQLVLGNKIALKGYFEEIVNQFKESYPIPSTNVRKLKLNPIENSKSKLNEYYKTEKDHIKRIQEICQSNNIPYVTHKSTANIKNLVQNLKNIIRKPNVFEKVYILGYKTALKLLEDGFYFLSRFGHWCPVQLYEHQCPIQSYYTSEAKERIIIPALYKNYIYFINGRDSAIKFMQSPIQYVEHDNMLSIFPIKIAIVGLHKSRKTSIAKRLSRQHGLEYIALEYAINYTLEKLHWSDLAKTISKHLRNGELIPQDSVIKCVEAFINGSAKSLTYGWVLDGYPNTVDDLQLMREHSIIPNVIFGIEPTDDYVNDTYCGLNDNRIEILNSVYRNNEFIAMADDEEEDEYYEMLYNPSKDTEMSMEETENLDEIANEEKPQKLEEYNDMEEEEEQEEEEIPPMYAKPPELEYIKKIKALLSSKHSSTIEISTFKDFDNNLIDFELNHLLQPTPLVEMRMLNWLKNVKDYDTLLDKSNTMWGNVHKIQWMKEEQRLLEMSNNVLTTYIWALQDYNLNIAKGLPASLHLVGITEEEYQSHKSPFNDCCPCCWYYYRVYFRCPTCQFKDMLPGLIQYENFFYWLCIQHYDLFLSNPIKFLMSYEIAYQKQYPEKTSIGESFLKNNLNVQYDGWCITCYFNSLPELKHVKGYGKHSVIVNKKNIYLFCSNKCACEMLMRPARYLNMDIDYSMEKKLPRLRKSKDRPCKGLFEQIVSEAIYDGIRKFLVFRPKIFKLSHKASACTYLALQLKLKAKSLSKREIKYYKQLLKYTEDHCKEVEVFCKNIDQIFAFMGPLSLIEQMKAKCPPRHVQDELLKNLLPKHTRPQDARPTRRHY